MQFLYPLNFFSMYSNLPSQSGFSMYGNLQSPFTVWPILISIANQSATKILLTVLLLNTLSYANEQ